MHPKNKKGRGLSADVAEGIATQALAFIADDPTRLGRFLAESGLGPENVRQAARDPNFLPAILDFILSHEADLLEFAVGIGIDPKYVEVARKALPCAQLGRST
jgi:hypothetical protein